MSKLYTNIRLLAVMAILSVALPGAFALKTTNLYLAEGSSAILMDYSYTDGDFVMRSTLSPGDNIVELKDYSHVYIFPAPGVETITVTPEDDCMKFVDDTRRGKKYYDVYASSKLQEKYTVTTSGGSAQLPTATVRLAPGSKARVLEKNERTLEYVPYKELAEGDNAVELMMESELVPGTVPFYYLCGEENYVLDVVTDGDGNNIEIKQDSFLGNYIELTAFNYKTEYNVTTKERRPAPQGDPVFILSHIISLHTVEARSISIPATTMPNLTARTIFSQPKVSTGCRSRTRTIMIFLSTRKKDAETYPHPGDTILPIISPQHPTKVRTRHSPSTSTT